MQPPIYNHHRLPPASGPAPSALAAGSSARLNELLDLIKVEFESAGVEGSQWKVQRDEYEGKIQQQINELGLIRQSMYELETMHNKARQDYETEILRLRKELDSIRPGASSALGPGAGFASNVGAGANGGGSGLGGPLGPGPIPGQPQGLGGAPELPRAEDPRFGMGLGGNGDARSPYAAPSLGRPPSVPPGAMHKDPRDPRGDGRDPRDARDGRAGGVAGVGSGAGGSERERMERERLIEREREMARDREREMQIRERDMREARGGDGRDPRDPRDGRDKRDVRDGRDGRDRERERDPRDPRDGRDPRDVRDPREREGMNRTPVQSGPGGPGGMGGGKDGILDRSGGPGGPGGPAQLTGGPGQIASAAHSQLQLQLGPGGQGGQGQGQAASPPELLSDLDPDNVSRELKKEGSDWFAVWSSQSKKMLDVALVQTLNHETVVCCVKFSNDGQYLATGCNRTAQIYQVKTGEKVCVLLDETTNRSGDLYIRSICFSPDGKFLATGAEDRQIRIWDIKQKRIRHLLQGHMQEIYSLDFSRDGRYLVSGSGDKSARVWDIESGRCVFDLRIDDFIHNEHGPIDAGITSVALSPDGKLVAAGSLDTMVRVWNVSTGQQIERLKGHKDSVYSVAFSPDGKCLVSGSLDKTLRVWDLSQTKRAVESAPITGKEMEKGLGTCQSTLNGHKDYVLSVAISPDGQWVVSGSKDRSIQFWNVQSGQAQFMLQGHKNSVISIDLARSGTYLASGSGDCMARIWKYEPMP